VTNGSLVVITINGDFGIMVILSFVDGETWLVGLESDTVPDLSTKQHP
jgi:hypothetical protein